MNFIWYILIGIVAGYVAGKIIRGGGFGLLYWESSVECWAVGYSLCSALLPRVLSEV